MEIEIAGGARSQFLPNKKQMLSPRIANILESLSAHLCLLVVGCLT